MVEWIGRSEVFDSNRVGLTPILNSVYGEHQLLVSLPGTGDVPLSQMGTGHQQLMTILGEAHISDCHILQVEEPEAHLYSSTMFKLASYLEGAVAGENASPARPFDQLFVATHSHQFAMAQKYLDVSLEDGETKAVWCDRAHAARHFYEPGPLWDVLRSLVNKGLPEDAVIFRDQEGRSVHAKEILRSSVHAKEILRSVEGDGKLAKDYDEIATEALVTALEKKTGGSKEPCLGLSCR